MEGGGGQVSNNFTIYLMLIICILLVTVDSIEIYRLSLAWTHSKASDVEFFNNCIKDELIIKTVFCAFSFAAACSALLLTIFLSTCIDYFANKFLTTFLYLNYFIFGPYMLAFCILGCIHFHDFIYVCNPKHLDEKILSLSNIFSLLCCMIIAILITIAVAIYEGVHLLVASILRKEDGIAIIRKVFWWSVLRQRTDEDLHIITSRQYIEDRMNMRV
jgi:hypothetical protein